MDTATEALVEARAAAVKGDFAHERLDKMNGSLDRNAREIAAIRAELSSKLDGVIRHLAETQAVEEAAEKHETSRYQRFQNAGVVSMYLGLIVALLALTCSVVAVLATTHVI